jgi:hypothetical protein
MNFRFKIGLSHWPLFGFDRVLECMRELSHQSEDYLESKLQNEVARELAEYESLNNSESGERIKVDETMAHQHYAIEMPYLHRISLLITLMSELEKRMNLCCDFIGAKVGICSSLEDHRGRGIDHAKNFILTHTKVRACFESRSWRRLILFRRIRNVATHAHKIADKQRAELERNNAQFDNPLFFFRKENFSHGDQLHLGPHCADALIEEIGLFFTHFEDELSRIHPEILAREYFLFSGEGGEDH